jgi:hypothetical protein
VGEKVPRPDPAKVAAGAAAAATALTLADPDSAGKKPEGPKDKPPTKPKRVKETVPGDVLDRAEAPDSEEELPPCPKPAKKPDEKADEGRRIQLIPAPVTELRDDKPKKPKRPKCREVKPEDEKDAP